LCFLVKIDSSDCIGDLLVVFVLNLFEFVVFTSAKQASTLVAPGLQNGVEVKVTVNVRRNQAIMAGEEFADLDFWEWVDA
jgi:hypothetical protein